MNAAGARSGAGDLTISVNRRMKSSETIVTSV